MSDIEIRGAEARRLKDDACFQEILAEIEADAVRVFKTASASLDHISAAHEKVRAVDVIRNAIAARIDAATFKAKKDQDRERHD